MVLDALWHSDKRLQKYCNCSWGSSFNLLYSY